MSQVFHLFAIIWKVSCEISHQFVLSLNLRKCVEYFFECWLLIHRPETLNFGRRNARRRLVLASLRTIQVVAAIRCAVWAALIVVAPNRHWRVIAWDQMLYEKHELNLIYLVITIGCSYMFHRVYFAGNVKDPHRETIWLVLQFLSVGDRRYAEESIMQVDSARARRILLHTLLSIQAFNSCLGALTLYYTGIVVFYVFQHAGHFFGSFLGLAELLLLCLNGLLLNLTLYLIMVQYFVQITMCVVFTYVTFSRLRRANALLNQLRQHWTPLQLTRFRRYHTQTLLDIFAANGAYGPTFLSFMASAGPTSAYQAMLLLTAPLHRFTFITCLNIILYQVVVCFIFHLVAAMYSNRVHRCKRTLMHLCACLPRQGTRLSTTVLFQLALYFERFHVKKKYGMTYCSLGNISFSSFFKFLLFYSEFLFYCYRWIKGID